MEKIVIDNYEIEVIRKPRVKRMSLKVQTSGEMRLTTALGTPEKLIRGFLLDHLGWMKKTQARFEKVRQKNPPKTYLQGDRFCFLGEQFYLQFEEGAKVSLNIDRGQHTMTLVVPAKYNSGSAAEGAGLNHRTNGNQNPLANGNQNPHAKGDQNYRANGNIAAETLRVELAKEYIRDFYSQVGRKYISGRIDALSELMKLKPTAISFRSQKTRWGSCSSQGRVTFNWRLAIAPPDVIDYVIIHELAHLKHMDHSDRFWNLVEKFCPDHKKLKRWLNKNRYESDFLADRSELHIGPERDDDLE